MLSSYDPYLDNLNKLNSKLSDGTCPGLLELGDQVRFGSEDPFLPNPILRLQTGYCLYGQVMQVSVLWVREKGVRRGL